MVKIIFISAFLISVSLALPSAVNNNEFQQWNSNSKETLNNELVSVYKGNSDDIDYENESKNLLLKPNPCPTEICLICKESVEIVKNPVIVFVVTWVSRHVCKFIPFFSDTCNEFVDVYTKYFIPYLNAHNNYFLCSVINACKLKSDDEVPYENNPSRITCPACVSIIQDFKRNVTQGLMEHKIEKICKYFPKKDQKRCKMLVDLTFSHLVSTYLEKVTPHRFCYNLKLCDYAFESMESEINENLII